MKRTVIYVFGPKRLKHNYNEGAMFDNNPTNWLKIGMTTTDDQTSDRWDIAALRVNQESRTGIPEVCVLLDVYEYPYMGGNQDDIVRKLLTDEIYTLPNSKANNKMVVDPYEIKAGREFVYGASRSKVSAAFAKYERDLLVKILKDPSKKDLLAQLLEDIKKNNEPDDDDINISGGNECLTSNAVSVASTTKLDFFYERLISKMPDNIRVKCNHTSGKNYTTIKSNVNCAKCYYLTFSLKRGVARIEFETWQGDDGKNWHSLL